MATDISNRNILRRLCWMLKICGLGSYWYESSHDDSKYYRWFTRLAFLHYIAVAVFEILEALLYTYPADLHEDVMFQAPAHVLIMLRIAAVINAKHKIQLYHKTVIEDCKTYENDGIMKKQYRKIKIALFLQTSAIYVILMLYWYEGLNRVSSKGLQFFVLIVYWPTYNDSSHVAMAARISAGVILMFLMSSLISAENLIVAHLIIMHHKLENLRKYFENTREEFLSPDRPTAEFKKVILDGIIAHNKVTSSVKKMQECFGYVMSMQLIQGSAITVLILIRLAVSDDFNAVKLVMNSITVAVIIIQLILYMWNAGDITYQAMLIGDAIFSCGWERRSARTHAGRELRRVVLMGIAQAQRPLVLKAFGMQDLSYSSFVSVLRATYSLFAVMHSTKK